LEEDKVLTRTTTALLLVSGAVIGALVGAILPVHSKELIYLAR
jgi:hypothetical protein